MATCGTVTRARRRIEQSGVSLTDAEGRSGRRQGKWRSGALVCGWRACVVSSVSGCRVRCIVPAGAVIECSTRGSSRHVSSRSCSVSGAMMGFATVLQVTTWTRLIGHRACRSTPLCIGPLPRHSASPLAVRAAYAACAFAGVPCRRRTTLLSVVPCFQTHALVVQCLVRVMVELMVPTVNIDAHHA